MNLADFQTLFDFLEHPVQIMHYLTARAEIETKYKILGDELDYMGLYVDTLLNIEDWAESSADRITITGMSEQLDLYYINRDQGFTVKKPKPQSSSLFKRIICQLEERSTPRWTEIGCVLNKFSPKEQVELIKHIKDLSKIVRKRWKIQGHKNTAIYSPPESSHYALAVVLFKNENSDQRHDFIDHAVATALEPEHVENCLVIAINIDDSSLAYHFIGLFEGQ